MSFKSLKNVDTVAYYTDLVNPHVDDIIMKFDLPGNRSIETSIGAGLHLEKARRSVIT